MYDDDDDDDNNNNNQHTVRKANRILSSIVKK